MLKGDGCGPVTVGPVALSDNDDHDLALSGNNMDNTTNNNDEVVTGAALLVELEAAPVVTEEADAAPVVEAVTEPVVEAALSDDSATGVVTETEGLVRCQYSDCDSAELAADHLSTEDDAETTDDEAEAEEGGALNTRTLSAEPLETEGLRFRGQSPRVEDTVLFRGGSDTESDAPPPPPAWPPMPTSPLRRQVGVTLSPVHGGLEGAGAGTDHIELVEAGPVEGALGDVPVPVWLFLAVIAAMLVYLTMVAYVLSWQCGVRIR